MSTCHDEKTNSTFMSRGEVNEKFEMKETSKNFSSVLVNIESSPLYHFGACAAWYMSQLLVFHVFCCTRRRKTSTPPSIVDVLKQKSIYQGRPTGNGFTFVINYLFPFTIKMVRQLERTFFINYVNDDDDFLWVVRSFQIMQKLCWNRWYFSRKKNVTIWRWRFTSHRRCSYFFQIYGHRVCYLIGFDDMLASIRLKLLSGTCFFEKDIATKKIFISCSCKRLLQNLLIQSLTFVLQWR